MSVTIEQISVKDQIETDFKDYSMYVIQARGIPNFYDALTPAQRLALLHAPDKLEATVALIGRVMQTGLYHHGDCLDGSTPIRLADGSTITISEWYNDYPDANLIVESWDPETNKMTYGMGHSPRIGQWTKDFYEIEMEDGTIIKCTANHPFLIDGKWVTAENLCRHDDMYHHGDKSR